MEHGSVAPKQISCAALALATLGLAGCGSAAHGGAPSAAQITADLRGSPAPLAALHAQANKLLVGGAKAFRAELRALRGYPVVVNKWGSWCTPCRQEFPIFQQVGALDARRVAFIGDDVNEPSTSAGAAWLRRFPVSYPSYADRSGAINEALGPASASYTPVTYFYDAAGKQVFFHYGPYPSAASLEHDIRTYLGA